MKQNIDLEQLNSLTTLGKQRLKDWLAKSQGPRYRVVALDPEGTVTSGEPDELITIGQMIEFLDGNIGVWQLLKQSEWHGGMYQLIFTKNVKELSELLHDGVLTFKSNDLCECLWSAVKSVLEREE